MLDRATMAYTVECDETAYSGIRWVHTFASRPTVDSEYHTQFIEAARGFFNYVSTLSDIDNYLPSPSDARTIKVRLTADTGMVFSVVTELPKNRYIKR